MTPDIPNENIGISGNDRLSNIERMLERILDKLDGKAEQQALTALEARVRDIELHGSQGLQATIHDVNAFKEQAAKDANAIKDQVAAVQRKLAYATGTIGTLVVFINIAVQYFSSH